MKTLEEALNVFRVRSVQEAVSAMGPRACLGAEIEQSRQAHEVAQDYLKFLQQKTEIISNQGFPDDQLVDEIRLAVWQVLLGALTHGILVGMEMEKQELPTQPEPPL